MFRISQSGDFETTLLHCAQWPSRRPGLCFLIHTKRQGDCDPKTIRIKVDLHIRTGLHGKHPFKQTRPEPLTGRELNGRPIVLIPHPAQLTGIFVFHRPSHFNPTPQLA